jgi:hypothetical protein
VASFEDWFRKFERYVVPFAKQTLWDFISSTYDYVPLVCETKKAKARGEFAETAAR